jgi:RHS repeat-associated protein
VADSLYTYDPLARLTTLEHAATSTFTGYLDSRINEFEYEYDDLNRITQKSSIDGTSAYTYDGAGQLIETDHTGTYQADDEGYDFDLNGNRLDVTGGGGGTSTYVIGPNNEILDDGVYTYTYDKEGNRLTKFRKTPTSTYDDYTFYTYDHRNRLVDVSFYDGDDPENDTLLIQRVYRYDYLDRRVSVTNPLDSSMAGQVRYAYDGLDIVFECTGLNSGWYFYAMAANFWVPDGENSLLISVDVVVGYMLRPSLIQWTFSDAQQTTTDIVQSNDEGTEFHRENHIVYDSAGNTVATWRHTYGWGGPTAQLLTRYLWQGLEYDYLTGLIYARKRFIDPKLSQFLNPDPIMFGAGQMNLRVLSGNDPVNYVDRSGLEQIVVVEGPYLRHDRLGNTYIYWTNVYGPSWYETYLGIGGTEYTKPCDAASFKIGRTLNNMAQVKKYLTHNSDDRLAFELYMDTIGMLQQAKMLAHQNKSVTLETGVQETVGVMGGPLLGALSSKSDDAGKAASRASKDLPADKIDVMVGMSKPSQKPSTGVRGPNEVPAKQAPKAPVQQTPKFSPNQMQNEIDIGKAPRSCDRVDVPKIKGEKLHVHLDKGKHALNVDGTWKHGGRALTNPEIEWLTKHGWTLPGKK